MLRERAALRLNLPSNSPALRDGTLINQVLESFLQQESGVITAQQAKEAIPGWSDQEKRDMLLLLVREIFGSEIRQSSEFTIECLKKLLNNQLLSPPEIIKLAGLLEVDPSSLQSQLKQFSQQDQPQHPTEAKAKRRPADGAGD